LRGEKLAREESFLFREDTLGTGSHEKAQNAQKRDKKKAKKALFLAAPPKRVDVLRI